MSYTLLGTVGTVPPFPTLCYTEKAVTFLFKCYVLIKYYDEVRMLKSFYKKATFEITNINTCIHTYITI